MAAEDKLNEELVEIFETTEYALPKKNAQIRRAVGRSRLMVSDILAKHTSSDGTIPRNKLTAVSNDIARIENDIYQQLRTELQLVLSNVSATTLTRLAEAVVAVIGVSALASLGLIADGLLDVAEGLIEALLWAITGTSYRAQIGSAVNSAFNRNDGDGKRLNDRLYVIGATLRKDIQTTIRQSIRNGESTAEILRKVERTYKQLDWRLDTITETEVLYTMRQTVAKFADESGLVAALKIIDFPHGDPKEHQRHKCYTYAHADEHGLGEGIYPVGTRKIRNPHPRCRSALMFVLIDELK